MPKKAILFVDDEKTVLTSLKGQIKKQFGSTYQYEIAESADEAWEVIEELNEDGIEIMVIVTDWLMPQVKGDEFLVQVHEKFPNIVKVMLTGQADDDAVERARQEANLHRCLRKPWDEQELIDTIRSGIAQV
ncbi:MAG: response regulator [Candidatus Parabeggiatoa sp. nov. 3]|jgi:CheY-like chemotaxis protein|nr:MAG: response regulator [Gammaproteobacteria bacterium]RKZ63495.1 MAG: response regulator [Gammaproteobacteria bacterium]RKZ85805.1 MAG: response regulator [Gammaproteobacteria bacterium]